MTSVVETAHVRPALKPPPWYSLRVDLPDGKGKLTARERSIFVRFFPVRTIT
jgi:hypothetical protein